MDIGDGALNVSFSFNPIKDLKSGLVNAITSIFPGGDSAPENQVQQVDTGYGAPALEPQTAAGCRQVPRQVCVRVPRNNCKEHITPKTYNFTAK